MYVPALFYMQDRSHHGLGLGHGLQLPTPGAKVPTILHPAVTAAFVVRIFAQAVVGTSIASLWPAYRATRLRPVEALAHT